MFAVAAYYNIAVKESRMQSCFIVNKSNFGSSYGMFFGFQKHPDDAAFFAGKHTPHSIPGNTTDPKSSTGYTITGLHAEIIAQGSTLYVYEFIRLVLNSAYLASSQTSHLHFNLTEHPTTKWVYSNKNRGLRLKAQEESHGNGTISYASPATKKACNKKWAELIKLVYEVTPRMPGMSPRNENHCLDRGAETCEENIKTPQSMAPSSPQPTSER